MSNLYSKYPKIESLDNALVKQVVKLGKDRSYREELNLSIIYGIHLVEEAFRHNVLETLIINEENLLKYISFIEQLEPVKIAIATPLVMKKLNILDGDIDIVGVVNTANYEIDHDLYDENCLVLESVQDPGNLGTIIRSARASGINNLLLSPNSVDPYNPKVLRSSQGAAFGMKIFTGVNLEDFIKNYKSKVIATTPHTKNSIYATDLSGPIAWVFGNEGAGLSEHILGKVQHQVTIPMQNQTESLNVAMAVTVCVFEQLRQRLSK